jgi:hypothetical protein
VQAFPQLAQSIILCLFFHQYNLATAKIITSSMLGTSCNYYKLGENDIMLIMCKKTFVKVFTRSLKMASIYVCKCMQDIQRGYFMFTNVCGKNDNEHWIHFAFAKDRGVQSLILC